MSFAITRKTFDVQIPDLESDACQIVARSNKRPKTEANQHPLRWTVELMGEAAPLLSPLPVDMASDQRYSIYRYDWVMGISGVPEAYWDWQGALREGSAVAFHLLVDPGESQLGFSYVSANLQVLHPSRNTNSWIEKYGKVLLDSLTAASIAGEAVWEKAGHLTKAMAQLSSTLETQTGDRRNWFVYQIFDDARDVCAIEWRIDKQVMKQYGPVLRGSIVLAFHGDEANPNAAEGLRLIARPQLGFVKKDEICFVSPMRSLPEKDQVTLTIKPSFQTGTDRKR